MKTNDDLMKELLTPTEYEEMKKEVAAEAALIRGGQRPNSGRKATVSGKLLKFTKRLTQEEVNFIDYARKHHINYDDIMQG